MILTAWWAGERGTEMFVHGTESQNAGQKEWDRTSQYRLSFALVSNLILRLVWMLVSSI